MTTMAINQPRTGGMTSEERLVIFASSLGTVFEWYDFYIYGTLGAFLAKYFFSNVPPNVGFIFALLAFAAGFAVRPFGALIFGRLGDMIGRKYTFLITMTPHGCRHVLHRRAAGLCDAGASLAPIVLIALRLVQGLALGGEYGGAAIYVAEHAPAEQARLLHVMDSDHRHARPVPRAAADPRHPHLHGRSGVRRLGLAHSRSCCRRSCSRFRSGSGSSSTSRRCSRAWSRKAKTPSGRWRKRSAQWSNAKIAILALFGATAGEAVVWYGGQFYALFFLTQTLKVPGVTAQIMIAIALRIGTPCFILFGWLSDKIGRKPIMLAGFVLAVVTYFPIFQGITHFANPKLEAALAAAPVTVTADPSECSFQFKATGTEKFTTPLRHHQGRAGQPVGELRQRDGAGRDGGKREDRRSDACRRRARCRQAQSPRQSRRTAIRPAPI